MFFFNFSFFSFFCFYYSILIFSNSFSILDFCFFSFFVFYYSILIFSNLFSILDFYLRYYYVFKPWFKKCYNFEFRKKEGATLTTIVFSSFFFKGP
jgi:hypothetical protein